MAKGSTEAWVLIHETLKTEKLNVDQIAKRFNLSRVTVSRILKASPVIEMHMTWPRTYGINIDKELKSPSAKPKPLNDEEKQILDAYLNQMLSPSARAVNITELFQAVNSVEGAKKLHQSLLDVAKVAEYYVTLLEE